MVVTSGAFANNLCDKETVVTICQKITTPEEAFKCADKNLPKVEVGKCGGDCHRKLVYCTGRDLIDLNEVFTSN